MSALFFKNFNAADPHQQFVDPDKKIADPDPAL